MTSGDQSIAKKAPLPGSAQNKLAVIFCAKNCEKTIAYAISSAKKSYFFRQGSGITIVVDGFSTDNTREVAKEAGAKPNLSVFFSRANDCRAAALSGEIYASTKAYGRLYSTKQRGRQMAAVLMCGF